MARDIVNFNAGPAGLPTPALNRAQSELLEFENTGMSIMEHSHRGKAYDKVHHEAMDLAKQLLGVPDTHEVLFLQGGASGMFATVPMNFLTEGKSADYILTGAWSQKAMAEAQLIGTAREAGTGKKDGAWVRIPSQAELSLDPEAAYVHMTSNNTIAGTQWHSFPKTDAPLVVDMSSDIMCRPQDPSQFHLMYAGAQKNLGPSGVVLVIINKAWAESGSKKIPKIFRYKTHLDKLSLYHTPPTFGIYLMRNVFLWMQEQGGLEGMAKRNAAKAELLYSAIDDSEGFYRNPVEKEARSIMNVVWRLPSEDLEARFISEADQAGLKGLKGHRDVGGCRASIYNAVELAGVERLVDFMKSFQAQR